MSLLKFPYTNLHELNLDWIIEQLNQSGAVTSVNGKHGSVTLTGEDINRDPNNPQTVEQALTSQGNSIQAARTLLGTTPLPTTAQTVTGAVDELSGDIGDVNEKIGNTHLPTTAQTLTGAIAEHETDITNINNKIGTTALPTTAQTITGAIAEHEQDITALNNQITTATEIELTAGTGITVPTGGIKCNKVGRVCFVTLNGLTFNSTGAFQINGLPNPITNVFAKAVSSNSATTEAISGNYAYLNNGTTTMGITIGTGNSNPHYICFCYITAL